MEASTDEVRSDVQQLAAALLDDVERIARLSVARMQELLPAYAKVPAEALLPVTLTNTRSLLQAVLDPDADPSRAEDHFRVSGETRSRQGITADDLLQAWRIGVESVREAAHVVAGRLGIADHVLLGFVEATLQWGDVGMRVSAKAHREAEIRELERLAAEQAALRRVATLVAQGARPGEVFTAVNQEVARLLPVTSTAMGGSSPTARPPLSPRGVPAAVWPSPSASAGTAGETTSPDSFSERVDRRALTTSQMPRVRSGCMRWMPAIGRPSAARSWSRAGCGAP